MSAIFKVDIQKLAGAEYWTNVYHLQAEDITSAAEIAGDVIVAYERSIHHTGVTFNRLRTSTLTPDDLIYISTPLTGGGDITPASHANALFDVIRIEIGVSGLGRPSAKYYRGCLQKDDWTGGGALTGTKIDFHQDALALMTANVASAGGLMVDPQGQEWASFACATFYGMRQLRRGTRRRTEPIIS
jgi:hypothetical protein